MERKDEMSSNDVTSKNDIFRIDRRTFVKVAGATVGALALGRFAFRPAAAVQSPQTTLAGSALPQFMDLLPTLDAAGGTMKTVTGNTALNLTMSEFDAYMLPTGTFAPGVKPVTKVWGYRTSAPVGAQDTYIGPVIVNQRRTAANLNPPTEVTWVNNLGSANTTSVLAYKYSTDKNLHWADPLNLEANNCAMGGIPAFGSDCAQNYTGPIPAVAHLHGGEVPPVLDGGPDAWFTSDGKYLGHGYYTKGKNYKGAVASLPVLQSAAYPPGTIVYLTTAQTGFPIGLYVVDALGTTWTPFTSNSATYAYPNTQEASPIWFHDHALGVTRLDVFAGLAGAYIITDPAYPWYSDSSNNLPKPIVPLVLQDRMFDTTGQLFFPADTAGGLQWSPNPDHPYWVPEFVGDTIVVNGKVWPYFNVAPQRYRFLFLNGSNARTYEMFLDNPVTKIMGPPIYQIGTDGGYLNAPVKIDPNAPKGQLQRLVLMPGERADVIIDFTGLPVGTRLILRNVAKTPYPSGTSPNGSTTGRIIELRVVVTDPNYNPGTFDPTAAGAALRGGAGQSPLLVRLVDPATGTLAVGVTAAKTRLLTLNEVLKPAANVINPVTGAMTAYPGGPLEILVNNTKYDGMSPRTYNDFTAITTAGLTTYYSELPQEGDTEVWEIVNLTADAHPMHLHLVQFQLMNRQGFNTNNYIGAYAAAFPGGGIDPATGLPYPAGVYIPAFGPPKDYRAANNPLSGGKDGGNLDIVPYLQGPVMPPAPNEAGWKDTVMAPPGMVTRIAVRWAPTDVPAGQTGSFPFNPDGGHGYVWHCHIIDHEDNEMMRPSSVKQLPGAPRSYNQGTNY